MSGMGDNHNTVNRLRNRGEIGTTLYPFNLEACGLMEMSRSWSHGACDGPHSLRVQALATHPATGMHLPRRNAATDSVTLVIESTSLGPVPAQGSHTEEHDQPSRKELIGRSVVAF